MNQQILIPSLLFFLSSTVCHTQNLTDGAAHHGENQIKTNPIIMLFPAWNAQYERFISSSQSFQLGVSYLDQATFIDTKMIGTVLTLDYKYYHRSNRKRATYLSPYLRYQNIKFQGNGDKLSYKKPGGGVDIGKVLYLTEWLVLDVNIGLNIMPTGYTTVETDGIVDVEIPKTLYGFGPRLGITLGVSF